MGCSVGAGSGDVVAAGKEVTGMVPSDPPGVMVQPRVTMHETSTSETQTVLMDIIDPDTLRHPIPLLHYFNLHLIVLNTFILLKIVRNSLEFKKKRLYTIKKLSRKSLKNGLRKRLFAAGARKSSHTGRGDVRGSSS